MKGVGQVQSASATSKGTKGSSTWLKDRPWSESSESENVRVSKMSDLDFGSPWRKSLDSLKRAANTVSKAAGLKRTGEGAGSERQIVSALDSSDGGMGHFDKLRESSVCEAEAG